MIKADTRRKMREAWLGARQLGTALLGWVFGYPLTWLVRRDRGLTVVIGRRGPVFADNTKYFFVFASQRAGSGERIVFLTTDAALAVQIESAGGAALRHPTWRSLYHVLRAGRMVMDMADWFDFGVYPLSRGAQLVQLWHGVPLKHIELDLFRPRLESLPPVVWHLLAAQKSVLGRYPTYDVVVSTSQAFVDKAFARSFFASHFLPTGYPRNDVLLQWPPLGGVAERLAWINVDRAVLDRVREAHLQRRRVALFVPTFRKDMASPFEEAIDLERWAAFAEREGLLIVIKLHPFMHGRYRIDAFANLVEYAPLGDVYPLMAQCDLLITDYSSIFLDFLLLDRPMVFFAYDLENYVSRDRAIYFPYASMAPGTTCRTQDELEDALLRILAAGCQDGYAERRATVRRFTHDHVDSQSALRLLAWLNEPGQRSKSDT